MLVMFVRYLNSPRPPSFVPCFFFPDCIHRLHSLVIPSPEQATLTHYSVAITPLRLRRARLQISPALLYQRQHTVLHKRPTTGQNTANMQFSAIKLAVLQAALLTSALPVEKRGTAIHSGKRIMLWDYTLTQDYASNGNIKTSASALSTSPGVTASFNWNTWKPEELPSDVPFEPMIRTPAQLQGDDWKNLISSIQAGGSNTKVHFYNEPELNGISAADAAAAWKSTVLPLRAQYGVKLVGPAVASNDAGSAWLQEFMGALSADQKPDFLGVHFYTNADTPAETEVQNAEKYFNDKHGEYGLPLVVSEIGSTSRDQNSVDTFTKGISSWLDDQDFVNSYGFFGATTKPVDGFVSPAAQLLDTSGSWTALGRWWVGQ
jgi:hypothetical protein